MIPLAPGPGNLAAMSWAWLSGSTVLLISFIGVLIGIPASIIAVWQFALPIARRAFALPARAPAVEPAPRPQPTPNVTMAPIGYTGGAVPTCGPSAAYAPVVPIANGANTIDLTGCSAPASEVIKVSDSDFAFARD